MADEKELIPPTSADDAEAPLVPFPAALVPADDVAAGVSLVIPAYNEAASIGGVIAKARAILQTCAPAFEVIVVNDGSTDDTAARAAAAGAKVVAHPYNRGYGNSLKSGIIASRFENIVICDADQSYPLEQLPLLLKDAHLYDMIVGARQGRNFHGSFYKRIGRWCQLKLVKFAVGMTIPDANSGFRLLKKSQAVRYFDFICSGFSFTTSITIALLCEQKLVKFVGVDYHKRCGSSHVRYFRDTLRSTQIILHCILRYNPLKVFLALGLLNVPVILACLLLALAQPWFLLGAGIFGGVMLTTMALGMLAYCITSSAARATVDMGVNAWANVGAAVPCGGLPACGHVDPPPSVREARAS